MARLAMRMILGESLESLGLKDKVIPYHCAKEAVLPWARFSVKTESFIKIMCHKDVAKSKASFGTKLGHFLRRHRCRSIKVLPLAFYKSQEAAGSELPHAPAAWENKKVLISLSNKEGQKDQVLLIGKTLADMGFTLVGTKASFAIR